MEEKIFFQQDNIVVTNTRFSVDGQTYAMSGITSVKSKAEVVPMWAKVILFLLGLILIPLYGFGLLVIIGIFFLKSRYSVMLSSASGETKALQSKDKALIDNIINALNQAIISRG